MFVTQVTMISLNMKSHNCIKAILLNKIEPEKWNLENYKNLILYNHIN